MTVRSVQIVKIGYSKLHI